MALSINYPFPICSPLHFSPQANTSPQIPPGQSSAPKPPTDIFMEGLKASLGLCQSTAQFPPRQISSTEGRRQLRSPSHIS